MSNSIALTPAQQKVANLLYEGVGNKTIAIKLDLADDTVKGHIRKILIASNVTTVKMFLALEIARLRKGMENVKK